MLLIFITERQGTPIALGNPSQTKITQTPALSFIFAFSALIKRLEVDGGGGPSSALYWIYRGSHPKIIFWVEFLERDVGVLWWGKAGKLDSDL